MSFSLKKEENARGVFLIDEAIGKTEKVSFLSIPIVLKSINREMSLFKFSKSTGLLVIKLGDKKLLKRSRRLDL